MKLLPSPPALGKRLDLQKELQDVKWRSFIVFRSLFSVMIMGSSWMRLNPTSLTNLSLTSLCFSFLTSQIGEIVLRLNQIMQENSSAEGLTPSEYSVNFRYFCLSVHIFLPLWQNYKIIWVSALFPKLYCLDYDTTLKTTCDLKSKHLIWFWHTLWPIWTSIFSCLKWEL